jgi:hypothetical protein
VPIAFLQDPSLALNDILLLILDNEVFVDDLHRHQHAEPSNKVHFGEPASPKAFDDFEIA